MNTLGKYPDILVEEKLGMVGPEQREKPWKNGVITFVAFLVFGSAPILAFIVLIPFTSSDKIKFIGACVLSAVALALLGIAKAKIAAQNYAASMGITLLNGLIAASAAYAIGWTLRNVAALEQ